MSATTMAAADAAATVALRRGGARGVMFAGAMAAGFYGIVLTVSMTAHIVDVLSRWYIGRGYDGTPLGYDFRLYSLAAAIVFNQIFFPDVSPAIGLV